MTNLKGKKGGISILGIIFFTVIAIIVLSYFNISIKAVVESPQAKDNFTYVGSTSRSLWNDYLAKPVHDILNSDVVKFFWNAFVSNMQSIHDGKPTDFQKFAPTVQFVPPKSN